MPTGKILTGTAIAGFTLIEALVALAVMGAGLGGDRLVGELQPARRPLCRAASRRRSRALARSSPACRLARRFPSGACTGALDAHDWRIDSTLVGAPAAVGDTLWTPQRIEVSVRSPSGATVQVDTIRLRRQPQK